MAFRKIEPATYGRALLTVPSVRVDKNGYTSFRIPRSILRDAGLPDFPGAKLDMMVGEGEDAGCVAITTGERISVINQGGGKAPMSVVVQSRQIGRAAFKAKPVLAVLANKGELILALPADFPWSAQGHAITDNYSMRASTNGQALAA